MKDNFTTNLNIKKDKLSEINQVKNEIVNDKLNHYIEKSKINNLLIR